MLMIAAVVVVFGSIIIAKWSLSSVYSIQVTINSLAHMIENNFKKSAFIVLLLAFITLREYCKMRERKCLTYRYITDPWRNTSSIKHQDSFKTDSDWNDY